MADEKVEIFLEELKLADEKKYQIAGAVRQAFRSVYPDIAERMMYGGIMFSLKGNDVGGVFASKKHVSVEFTSGYLMTDPDKHLEGSGKFRRHLKLREKDDTEKKALIHFIRQSGQDPEVQ